MFGLSAAIFFGQPLLAKQLDNWQLLPRPEHVTEFYFSNYRDVPVAANSDGARTVKFTVHNLEHQTVNYRYTLSVVSADGDTERPVASGHFALDHNRFLTTNKHITLPLTKGRVAIKATLEYKGVTLGERVPSAQAQSIHYWTTATAPNGDKEGHEGA